MKPIEIFRKDYIVGLDIGTSSVKLAQFLKTQDGLQLVRTDLEEVGYKDNEALREKEMQDLLKKMTRNIDIKNSKFIVTVNCPRTALKKVVVPYMPKGELHDAILLAAKNYFPFSIDDSLIDFEILSETVEKGIKKFQVLVATSPKKTIDKYLSLLGGVGIRPASFVPIPYAIQKLVEAIYSNESKVLCFLDIGMRHTELAIFKAGDLVFSRKIPTGGADLTKEMTEVLVSDRGRTELSWDEAEKIKREIGIPTEDKSEIIGDKISTLQILSMIRAPLEQLKSEIERCFDYCREETGGGKIDGGVLLGGGSSLKGLEGFLSKELGIEVRLGDSLEGLKSETGAIDRNVAALHTLALAIGSGLSEAKGLNLLPPEIKEETKRTFKRATVQAVVAGTILILAFVYIGINIQLNNFHKRIAAGGMELSSLGLQLAQVEIQNLTKEILQDEPYWEDVFKELSNLISDDIYLTSISTEGKLIRMKGVIVSERREESLSNFMLALEKGMFGNVKLVTTKETREKSANEFESTCTVD